MNGLILTIKTIGLVTTRISNVGITKDTWLDINNKDKWLGIKKDICISINKKEK